MNFGFGIADLGLRISDFVFAKLTLRAKGIIGQTKSEIRNPTSEMFSMPTTVTDIIVRDIRFPTSRSLDGSDAMNADPNYSAAYVILQTDSTEGLEGHGLTFTIGRGNELCVAAIDALKPLVVGTT